ncbi:MAG: tetratricopeptide repeat protein [Pyrinomonadaceae bacterium]|nr:tetratricopeptide repeat protein [Pyrinomonadaceae bacterium]MCX7639449.1 tetratricopeptide repeat protein [Pyrinomonadaceae bacterium]MDW8304501.1 tetratricopeptide repeat protein [Acidobacteriota bacterium]
MRKLFLIFFLAILPLSCSDKSVIENTISNQAKNASPIIFSNADEALAAGKNYLDENKIEEAIEALKQAIKLNPESADAYFHLGIALSIKEMEEEKQPESNTNIKSGKPVILSESDKAFNLAAKLYKKITEREPNNAEAFFNLGRAYSKVQMDEEAEKALRQAVKLRPDETEYYTELGVILIKLAKYEEAIRVLRKAQELDENNLRALDLLEQAQAGKQRVSFTMKPKTPKPKQEELEEEPTPTEETISPEKTPESETVKNEVKEKP